MPQAIWTGSVSFGLVTVPVRVVSATKSLDVRFHQLEAGTNARVRQRRVSEQTGEEVAYDQIVKGYELESGNYVVIDNDELAALAPKASRQIEIEDFVDLVDIDPVYFENPYFLVPDKGAAKAYGLLLNAMQASDKVAIARVVIRSKEALVAIRPAGDLLMMETMIFHDEVVPHDDLDDLPDSKDLKVSDREVKMAQQLIDSLSSEFDPSQYRDEYRDKVLELIERKASGEEIVAPAAAAEPDRVVDLMAALEASVAAAKDARTRHPAARAPKSVTKHPDEADAAEDEADAEAKPKRVRKRAAKSA